MMMMMAMMINDDDDGGKEEKIQTIETVINLIHIGLIQYRPYSRLIIRQACLEYSGLLPGPHMDQNSEIFC